MIRRPDWDGVARVFVAAGLVRGEHSRFPVFVERDRLNSRSGVHVIFANEPVRPHETRNSPDISGATRAASGFLVLDLPSLVAMKLDAFRRVDQVHIEDMLRVGLIDARIAAGLPDDLLARLREIRDTMEWFTEPPSF